MYKGDRRAWERAEEQMKSMIAPRQQTLTVLKISEIGVTLLEFTGAHFNLPNL
jgi:hypothetical protein